MGTKTEHLAMASQNRYPPHRLLMIGDAPGDLKAARANGALFYPVIPAHEEESWSKLFEEALGRFFNETYAGEYETTLVEEFEEYLPEEPPWKG
jgi:hypothetical protein